MDRLPSGTVTLLFSDIEGSTQLLSRLGVEYADALDGQRRVLREAWSKHGGVELGTEGDSFYVVFTTAADAVAAAAQAQLGVESYRWPQKERLRIRMGIHTGSPIRHGDAYVGMDVHRAARIAGAAHGGQVVISSATAELVPEGTPVGVALRDLGHHHLKDIERPEHLHQLVVEGLAADFPPLKTLGTSTSLPSPAGALVGRDGELAKLTELIRRDDVRLVTLVGAGGSGKTRLAIELARTLVPYFPDGAYFVPLAPVTQAPAMWSTIAEVLDVAPEDRTIAGFVERLRNTQALIVLDNLEQLRDAASVVAEITGRIPGIAVVATSRRPLHVDGEHERQVPPLELPNGADPASAARSGAVQLFMQQARRMQSGFELTADNAADVSAVCRHLDGLPLAIEIAASRTKLLSPKALLARLDTALDIRTVDRRRPDRQQTLRQTIGWSYDLLPPDPQRLFRRLSVFSGGANLDAVATVAVPEDAEAASGVIDLLLDLVDLSLVTVTEAADGEPRVDMLETIHAYAGDQLATSGELATIQRRHAEHFLQVATATAPNLNGPDYIAATQRLDLEHDNFREALSWATGSARTSPTSPDPGARTDLALALCAELGGYWFANSHFTEGRAWLERAISLAGDEDRRLLARCLTLLSNQARPLGDLDQAFETATASVQMWRRLPHADPAYPHALRTLAAIARIVPGDTDVGALYEEALASSREIGHVGQTAQALGELGGYLAEQGDLERCYELETEAIVLAEQKGDLHLRLLFQHNRACTLRMLGRIDEAHQQMRSTVPEALAGTDMAGMIAQAEDYGAILAALGDHRRAVRMFGAADADREQRGWSHDRQQDEELADAVAATRDALTPEQWDAEYQAGRKLSVENVIRDAYNAGGPMT